MTKNPGSRTGLQAGDRFTSEGWKRAPYEAPKAAAKGTGFPWYVAVAAVALVALSLVVLALSLG